MIFNSKYVIITPAHNEAGFIKRTIQSVAGQSIKPSQWLVVDDGSTDETANIVKDFQRKYDFIKLLSLPGHEGASHAEGLLAAKEAIAFNHGLRNLTVLDYEFIVKLDADLEFDYQYFEGLLAHFQKDKYLGIAGGQFFHQKGSSFVKENVPEDHVRGATKMYRQNCFESILGIEEVLGWDTIDEIKAQMKGWRTKSFYDCQVMHLRPTGSIGGILKGKARHGLTAYKLGYHPIFMIGRAVRRLFESPKLMGSLAMLYGFAKGYTTRQPLIVDFDQKLFLRQQQFKRTNFLSKKESESF